MELKETTTVGPAVKKDGAACPRHVYYIAKGQTSVFPVFEYAYRQSYTDGKNAKQLDKDAALQALEQFDRNIIQDLGATTESGWTGCYYAFSFHIPEGRIRESKKDYFWHKLIGLKQFVQGITLDGILDNGIPSLDSFLNDKNDDWIVLQNGRMVQNMTLDQFILTMEPDTEYYVQKSVLALYEI